MPGFRAIRQTICDEVGSDVEPLPVVVYRVPQSPPLRRAVPTESVVRGLCAFLTLLHGSPQPHFGPEVAQVVSVRSKIVRKNPLDSKVIIFRFLRTRMIVLVLIGHRVHCRSSPGDEYGVGSCGSSGIGDVFLASENRQNREMGFDCGFIFCLPVEPDTPAADGLGGLGRCIPVCRL